MKNTTPAYRRAPPTTETRERISRAMSDRQLSRATKRKMSLAKLGAKNPNYGCKYWGRNKNNGLPQR